MITAAAHRVKVDRSSAAAIAVLIFLLLCLMPPDGVLSDNEEDYFQLAAQSVSMVAPAPESAVFDGSRHRIVADVLLGKLIAVVGFETAQIITRILAALAYAVVLRLVFRRLGLSALDAALVIIVFALLGQAIIGGEWLFSGFEAKVAAYIFVLAGLAVTLSRRSLFGAALFFAVATYLHFLVGGFWFVAAMALRLTPALSGGERGAFASVARASVLYVLAVAPLVVLIAWTRFDDAARPVAGIPSPDVIYSIIRAPWHTSPFLTWRFFTGQWLPGYLLAGAMLATVLVIVQAPEGAPLRAVALWLAGLLVYLFLTLLAAFFDRHTGALGKFYLFRPSSLVLLLWLAPAVGFLGRLLQRHERVVKLLALALVLPPFLLGAAKRIEGDVASGAALAEDKRALAGFLVGNAAPGAVVLIDPQLEFSFLDFERRAGHPMLIAWKFMPTGEREIVEWYRRMEFRKAVFEQGCTRDAPYRVDYLLTTSERAPALVSSCGRLAFATGRLALLRRGG